MHSSVLLDLPRRLSRGHELCCDLGQSCRLSFQFSGWCAKKASDRRFKYPLKKRSPLQFSAACAALFLVPFVCCSTPEALNHIVHAPSKGGSRCRGAPTANHGCCINRAIRPIRKPLGEKVPSKSACLPAWLLDNTRRDVAFKRVVGIWVTGDRLI